MRLFDFKKSQSAINIFLPLISLFMLGIILLISAILSYTTAATIIAAYPTIPELPVIFNQIMGVYTMYDYGIMILSVAFIIAIGFTSYRIRTYPIYYIITFIVSAFYGFIAYILSYTFEQYASNPVFTVILYLFPRTILFLSNLHWIALAMIIISAIMLYSGNQQSEIPLR